MNTEFEIRINCFYGITEIHFQNLVKYGEVLDPPICCVSCATVFTNFCFCYNMHLCFKKSNLGED